jgi:hypothetical protein
MTNDTIKLAVDGAHGIHVSKRFFELYPQFLERLNDEDKKIITNPDHEHYNEVWDDFYRNFSVRLHTDSGDGDVFFVRDDHEWDE